MTTDKDAEFRAYVEDQKAKFGTSGRELHVYDLPKHMEYASIGLVELTYAEEAMAGKSATGNFDLLLALALYSLRYATKRDGTELRLSAHDGSAQRVFDALKSAGRQLAILAYNDMTRGEDSPSPADFLATKRVTAL